MNLPTIPGTPFAGGFYVARFYVAGHEYLLVDAGLAGELKGEWGEYGVSIAASHRLNGLANTRAMAEAGSELARQALMLDIGGFTDWYIPAQGEQWLQFSLLAAEGYQPGQPHAFSREWHWSSTQFSPYLAWFQLFGDGFQYSGRKDNTYRARAVRRFPI